MKITFENRKEILKQLDKTNCVKFAIKCARLVSHLNDDPRVEAAIVAAENWLEDPSKENRQAVYDAHAAAYAAAHNTAAYGAAYAANAASTAAYTANVASIASHAANAAYAANAAANTVEADPTTKQQVVQLLKEIYLESLPEEERNCWLVQATLGV